MQLKTMIVFLRQAYGAMRVEGSRYKLDIFSDRIAKACSAPTLARAMEYLLHGINADVAKIDPKVAAQAMAVAQSDKANAVLRWLREHGKIAAMLVTINDANVLLDEALQGIDLPEAKTGQAAKRLAFEVTIKATCQAPLAHGAEGKAGNATLFRRIGVLATNGVALELPYYAGNAVRGQMRDLLADHFLTAIGLTADRSKPAVALWFFHALYAGGTLEDKSDATKALGKLMGSNGAIKGDGIRIFRNMLPALSLLGCALGNRVLPGRIQFADLRPRCWEWGTGETPVAELMDWEFLTRREDHEAHQDHVGMIANTEVLRPGTVLDGGVDYDSTATELERSALGHGLALLQQRGMLGAENRRGLGRVGMQIDHCLDPAPYLEHLGKNSQAIVEFLSEIGALPKGESK